tara:strand:+ start:1958 stop:2197 length:240 start_codon:yes stop_codon:yes gene_type:complete
MLNAKRMGIAGGIVLGVLTLVLTVIGVLFGHGLTFLGILTSLFPLYSVTMVGSIIGLINGFILGFIIFYLLIHVYDLVG